MKEENSTVPTQPFVIDQPLPPTPTPETINPFPPVTPPVISPQPAIVQIPPTPNVINVTDVQPSSENSSPKKWIWIVAGVVGVIILAIIVFFVFKLLIPKSSNLSLSESSGYSDMSYEGTAISGATPLPVTIAPPGTPDWRLDQYRTKRATVSEAQEMNKTVGPTIGEIQFPASLSFSHEEIYKGIPIRWTDGQPISPQRLEWLKAAIDKLPPLFINDHPVMGIYSATLDEMGITDGLTKSKASISSAFQSGLKIVLTKNILIDTPGYVPKTQTEFESTIFHEWMHIVQYYEALQTFSDSYLAIPGNSIIAISLSPFTKDFAKEVGWEFPNDEAGNGWIGTLKKDPESQKTSDYGKTEYYEDQADTAAAFFTCQTSEYSQTRIGWMEKTTNTIAGSYCH